MLCCARKIGSSITIGIDIQVTLNAIERDWVKVYVETPERSQEVVIEYNTGYTIRPGIVVRYNGLRHGNKGVAMIGIEAPRSVPICRDDAVVKSPA